MKPAYLYHGTRYARAILADNEIRLPTSGVRAVSMSRCPRVALYFAELPRDDDEGRGAVLVLDREKLRTRYRLECFRDAIWDLSEGPPLNEFEEQVYGRPIKGLSRYLVEIRWLPVDSHSEAV